MLPPHLPVIAIGSKAFYLLSVFSSADAPAPVYVIIQIFDLLRICSSAVSSAQVQESDLHATVRDATANSW